MFVSALSCYADTVKVKRKIPAKEEKPLLDNNGYSSQSYNNSVSQDNLEIIKNIVRKYTRAKLNLPQEKFEDVWSLDYCNLKYELEKLGAENIDVLVLYNPQECTGKNFIKISGRTFKNPKRCLKVTFNYKKRAYVHGWCK